VRAKDRADEILPELPKRPPCIFQGAVWHAEGRCRNDDGIGRKAFIDQLIHLLHVDIVGRAVQARSTSDRGLGLCRAPTAHHIAIADTECYMSVWRLRSP